MRFKKFRSLFYAVDFSRLKIFANFTSHNYELTMNVYYFQVTQKLTRVSFISWNSAFNLTICNFLLNLFFRNRSNL